MESVGWEVEVFAYFVTLETGEIILNFGWECSQIRMGFQISNVKVAIPLDCST